MPQQIENRFTDMLALVADLPDFTVFFNGARCGASAPDHMHFQAGSRHFIMHRGTSSNRGTGSPAHYG